MKQKRFFILVVVLLLLMVSTSVVLAQSNGGTVVETDETIRNDIALFGEDLVIEEGATVKGDVALFGGNATIAGTVDGDIVLFGGNLTAASTAVIDGDCALLGGSLTDDTDEGINCTAASFGANFAPAFSEFAGRFNFEPPVPPEMPEIEIRRPSAARQFFGGVAEAAGQTLVMALLAFGVASLLPNHLTQVETAVRQKPMTSGAMGSLTFIAVAAVIFLLLASVVICIGIFLLPVTFLIGVGLVAATALGWITVGNVIGRWLAERINLQNRSLPVTAALGTAALTFGIGFVAATPSILGLLFVILISIVLLSIGLGAATLTRLGTRPYPLYAGYAAPARAEKAVTENPDKINAVLETLPVEDVEDLKNN